MKLRVLLYVFSDSGFHYHLTWMMNKPRLLQMQGAGHEVAVLHYECSGTKQML